MKTIFKLSLFVFIFIILNKVYSQDSLLTRKQLIEDTRELVRQLELNHPDPYINGGGKIAFHRRFQTILREIPKNGMTIYDYYKHLLPLIASIEDVHTYILSPLKINTSSGIPIGMRIIDNNLVVSFVYSDILKYLVGAKLLSVDDIPFKELIKRQSKLRGYENEVDNLVNLSINLTKYRDRIHRLIPEWQDSSSIKAVFLTADGQSHEIFFQYDASRSLKPIHKESKINLPSTDKFEIAYNFIDRNIALLRISGCVEYRENLENSQNSGYPNNEMIKWAKGIYQKQYKKNPPDSINEIIPRLMSATDVFISLFKEMKQNRTDNLIIDLRDNSGGGSLITEIFIYYLMNFKEAISQFPNYAITKYSTSYFESLPKPSIDEINNNQEIKLEIGDYDFQYEIAYNKNDFDLILKDYDKIFLTMPTFNQYYKINKYNAFYKPKNIYVLTSSNTYSAGYYFAVFLYKIGAKLIGTPPGQSGNCFIESLNHFYLPNSNLEGRISDKYMVMFPDDNSKGKLLIPDYQLTYDKYSHFDFDPNSEILFTLEIINNTNK
jgi:hypothetical protein